MSLRPLTGVGTGMGVGAPGRDEPAGKATPWASWRLISRDYFKTMGVALLKGRDFTEHDQLAKPWRAIISRRLAEMLWPGEDPIGRTLTMWKGQSNDPAEVIGVAADMRDWGLAGDPSLAVYLPYYGGGFSPVQFVLHASVPPAGQVPALRSILAELDPNLPISNIESIDEMVAGPVASRRFTMLLFGSLAAVALLLALAGVYGVLAYAVSNRTAEIGTRMALGASPGSVLRLIVGQGMRPVLAGLTVGVVGALALSRLMSGLLFEVTPGDLPTYAAVAVLLVGAAAISCYLPARKAVRVDVVAALRDE